VIIWEYLRSLTLKGLPPGLRPNMPITLEIEMVQPKRTIGRPRSLTETDLARVLSLSKAGLGSRSITQELQRAGVDVSRPTVQRALAKRGVYAN